MKHFFKEEPIIQQQKNKNSNRKLLKTQKSFMKQNYIPLDFDRTIDEQNKL